MHVRQRHAFDALMRAAALVTKDPLPTALAGLPPAFGAQVRALADAIATIDSYASDQQSGEPQRVTAERRALKAKLRHRHLIPLSRVARVLQRATPGISLLINVPHELGNEQSLVSSARAALNDVEPYRDLFVGAGFPLDFETQLSAAIQAVEEGKHKAAAAQARRGAATSGIRAALTRGRDAVHCLDAIVRRCCAADDVNGPPTLSDWESARRIHKSGGSGTSAQQIVPGAPGREEAVAQAVAEAVAQAEAIRPLPNAA